MKRVFIALPVSSEIEDKLVITQNKIKKLCPDANIRWIEPGSFHITLEFLGEIDNDALLDVQDRLDMLIPNYPAFSFSLDKLFGFPNIKSPNVIVARALDNDRTSFQLREDIHKQLKELDLADNGRPWKPHITLGRVDSLSKPGALKSVEVPKGSWKVGKVIVYESFLTKSGAVYRSLSKHFLKRR